MRSPGKFGPFWMGYSPRPDDRYRGYTCVSVGLALCARPRSPTVRRVVEAVCQ